MNILFNYDSFRKIRPAERILFLFSRNPGSTDYKTTEWSISSALLLLEERFPGFKTIIQDKEILDLGCGEGYQTISMANSGAKYVVGIDINEKYLAKARQMTREYEVISRVEILNDIQKSSVRKFDIVISQDSMEHFSKPELMIDKMLGVLRPNGKIFITFGPPWYSAYGGHMNFFTKFPWVTLLFSEKTVLNVRKHYRNDSVITYEEIEGGLNKMTVKRFERILLASKMQIEFSKYNCIKKFNFLARLPVLRELFINRISYILSPEPYGERRA